MFTCSRHHQRNDVVELKVNRSVETQEAFSTAKVSSY